MSYKIVRKSDEIAMLIRERTPFRTAIRKTRYGTLVSMSGHSADLRPDWTGNESYINVRRCTGNLPGAYAPSVLEADYVVLSYNTPIAWHIDTPLDLTNADDVRRYVEGEEVDGQWIVPEVKYSITTTDHQGTVRSALSGYVSRWWDLDERPRPLPEVALSIPGAATRVACGVKRF